MKEMNKAEEAYWQMTDLDQWVHSVLYEGEGKPHGRIKTAAIEIVMSAIAQKFKSLKKETEETLSPHQELTTNHKKILKAIAKIHNDLGFSISSGDFDQLHVE